MDFEYGCEECGIENEDLLDTVLDNKPMRLCEKCARTNGALILKEEEEKNLEKWNDRRAKKPEQTYREEPRVSLQGLWDRYKSKMGERNTLEKQNKMAVLEEKKFLEDLEKQEQLENKEIVQAVDGDFDPDYRVEEQEQFDKEASKKVDIKGFFKQTFKFLNKEKKESEGKEESRDIPEMVPEMIEVWRKGKMKINVLKKEKNELEIEIDNLTVAELLRNELWEDESIEVSAWRRDNPSKDPILVVKTKGKDAKKVLFDAIARLQDKNKEIIKEFKKVF